MKYITGEFIEIGDKILFENGKTIGEIFDILDTLHKANQWGIDGIGVTVKAEPFGLVFLPLPEELGDIILISK